MSADRKAAMKHALNVERFPEDFDDYKRNLAAAFREVTAELETERKALEEARRELYVTKKQSEEYVLAARSELKAVEQRATDLQARLDRMEVASLSAAALLQRWANQIKDCNTTWDGEWGHEEEAEADYIELIKAIRALAAAGGQTNAADGQPLVTSELSSGSAEPAPSAAPDAALPGLELAAKICENASFAIEISKWSEMTKKQHGEYACHACAKAIRAEIAKRTK